MSQVDWNGLSGAFAAAGTFASTIVGGYLALKAQRRPAGSRARRLARRQLRRADRRLADAEAEVESARVQRAYAVRAVADVDAEEARERSGVPAAAPAAPAAAGAVPPLVRSVGPWTAEVLLGRQPAGREAGSGAPPTT